MSFTDRGEFRYGKQTSTNQKGKKDRSGISGRHAGSKQTDDQLDRERKMHAFARAGSGSGTSTWSAAGGIIHSREQVSEELTGRNRE